MFATRLTLQQFGAAYGAALLAMMVLDGLWLGVIAMPFYKQEIGPLMLDTPKWLPAALFYVFYPLGLVFLALYMPPASMAEAVLRCAVVGLVAYGVYDLSNLATLRGWSVKIAVVDMLWGTFASGVAGALAYVMARKLA